MFRVKPQFSLAFWSSVSTYAAVVLAFKALLQIPWALGLLPQLERLESVVWLLQLLGLKPRAKAGLLELLLVSHHTEI